MTEKKERCKFTIQFNPADPNHGQVIDLLNSQGRRKAQFIVNAVLHYLNCSETPSIPQPSPRMVACKILLTKCYLIVTIYTIIISIDFLNILWYNYFVNHEQIYSEVYL